MLFKRSIDFYPDRLLGRRLTHQIRKILSRNVTPEMEVSIDFTTFSRRNSDAYAYNICAGRPCLGPVQDDTESKQKIM